jgi:hypothetical protein
MGSTAIDLSAGMVQRQGTVDLSAGLLPKAQSGAQVNDVGNLVITPRQGESFADTMQRAAAYGKTVTPQQINAEVQTIPGKAAATLAAAPTLGVAGTAALAGTGELASYGFRTLQSLLPDKATADQIIKVGKIVRDLSLTTAAGKYLYHQIYGNE